MEDSPPGGPGELGDTCLSLARYRRGAILLRGPAGSGRTEALARRLASFGGVGVGPERALVLTASRAAATRLRERAEALLPAPYEELLIGTYRSLAERLLREHALEAGLDPFFTTVDPADRLAILLDRVDDLPLRRHEIRGNPGGLLARLLRRIDTLKAAAVSPGALHDWAADREREASTPARREAAQRELEFCELYSRHDRILRDLGSLDANDLTLELARLLRDRPDVAERLADRFPHLLIDEFEDAGVAQRALLDRLASDGGSVVCALDEHQAVRAYRASAAGAVGWFRERFPDAREVELSGSRRSEPAIAAATAAIVGDRIRAIPDDDRDRSSVRLWRSAGERAEAQAAAREIEQLLSAAEVRPEAICVVVASGWREARVVAAALEERGVPFRFTGDAALFQRPEVRDALAWLRMLADPNDSAAVVRAITRPPVELRSVDLARCTTIARRRKLDLISALDAALESPQLPPEARDRIQSFLKLHAAAASALEEMRPDAFVRRLVERIGLRRHRLFAASPETAERLRNLSRLADLAAVWARREPQGSVRDFIRHIAAVADSVELGAEDPLPPPPGAILLAEPEQVKGLEFDRLYLLGLHRDALAPRPWEDRWVPDELVTERLPAPNPELGAIRRAQLAYVAVSRARHGLVLSWPEDAGEGGAGPSPVYETVREALALSEETHEEELFGPAEGLHATYRMLRDEVLEASWRAGSALSEMRLDTAEDVNRAVARYLELVKLAALIQRPGVEPAAEALAALNELLARVASPEQRAALETSALDEYVAGEERERSARRDLVAARREPSLEAFLPRRGDGLGLSASDIDLYRICPLKYKFARVFAIPQEPTVNQRFGILIHQVLERFHAEELRSRAGAPAPLADRSAPGSLDRLLHLFEAGWRRAGFRASDDELQYRDRAVAALARYHERHERSPSRPVWLERSFSFRIGPHQLRGRVDRVDRLPEGGYELIDYKTGERRDAPLGGLGASDDVQLALYRMGAREAWEVEAEAGSYWYVLEDERVTVPTEPDDPERVERTVLEVAAGIEGQDFEPRPSYEICSWCDYRLICPASEA